MVMWLSARSDPEEGELPYFLRGGLPFRPVVQAPALRRHAVAGGLPREGLSEERQALELGRVMVCTLTNRTVAFLHLNQSQGGMCMSGVLRVGVGVPRQGAGP